MQIERNLAITGDKGERDEIFLKGAFHFKSKATANRIPAVVLSGVGGIAFIGLLTSSKGTNDPYANVLMVGGLAYIAQSIPFYIRASQLTKISKSLEAGILPRKRTYHIVPAIATKGKTPLLGFRVIF